MNGNLLFNLFSATMFALKVVDIARYYNVGIEIDYEESAAPLLAELETFMQTYRNEIPFDDSANPYPPSLLTIDFGQGAQVRFSTLSTLIMQVYVFSVLICRILYQCHFSSWDQWRTG